MQLTQAEAFGVLDEHDNGIGNIHTHFHHRCGDQQVDFPIFELPHNFVLFGGFHLAVEQSHPIVRKVMLLQVLGVFRGGHQPQIHLAGLHQRTDDISLVSLVQMLFDVAIGPLPFGAIDGVGLDRQTAHRHGVDDRDVQVAIDHQSQRPGDGGGGHDQRMRALSLLAQGDALSHARTGAVHR